MPVSSYAPELLEAFKLANREVYVIDLKSKATAIKLRARFHNLRRDMRKENHPLTHIANGVTLSITNAGDLSIGPADSKFVDALHKAGIAIKAPTAGSPSGSDVPVTPIPDPAVGGGVSEQVGEVLDQFFKSSPEGERKDGTDRNT